MYLLAQHPEAEARLRQELETVLGSDLPTLDNLLRLPYTGRVFREVLRLYPPAWVIAREAVTAYRLGPIEVSPGATLFMSPYATQRDPRFWKDPEQFNPNRWLEEANRPKFAFYPFGAGTRVCIGEHFAMMEGHSADSRAGSALEIAPRARPEGRALAKNYLEAQKLHLLQTRLTDVGSLTNHQGSIKPRPVCVG